MKVSIDHRLCEGFGECEAMAREVFEIRDDNKSHVVVAEVPAELESHVREAAGLCPTLAINIQED